MPRRSLGGDMLPSSGCGHAAPRMWMSRSTAPRAAPWGQRMLRGVVLGSDAPLPHCSCSPSAKMFMEERGEHALSTLNLFFFYFLLHHWMDEHLILKIKNL